MEQILRARLHWSPARLLGHEAEQAAHQLHATDDEALPVLGTLDADTWRPRPARLPNTDRRPPSPGQLRHLLRDIQADFWVVVGDRGCELLYPKSSILLCRRLRRAEGPREGNCVILQHQRGMEYMLAAREIVHHQGQQWLWPRSTEPDCQTPIPLPFPGRQIIDGQDKWTVLGVVVAGWHIET